jgi:hypothetical protein
MDFHVLKTTKFFGKIFRAFTYWFLPFSALNFPKSVSQFTWQIISCTALPLCKNFIFHLGMVAICKLAIL